MLKDIVQNNEILEDTVGLGELDYVIPEKTITFISHQAYVLYWFEVDEKVADPICHYFHESKEVQKPEEKGKFSEVIFNLATGTIELWNL